MKTTRKQSSGRRVKNAALWFYILAMGCIVIQLMSVIYHFNGTVDFRWLQQVSTKTLSLLITNSIADALILLLPFVALPPKWRKWIWIVLWLVTFWCLAQLLYIPSYRDLMPFSSFLLVGNVGSTLATSTMGAMRLSYFLEVVLPPILLYIAYRMWFKRSIEASRQPGSHRWCWALLSIVAFVLIRFGVTGVHYLDDDQTSTMSEQLTNDYAVMWTRQGDYVNSNGVVPYAIYCATTSILNEFPLSDSEKQMVNSFLNEQPHYTDNEYASASGKNVILLVVESLNSWVIDLKINGREVTPTLNALCRDTEHNMVSLKMKAQVKNGRSSDGIFIYNTGLLPLTTQVVANTYEDVPYPTLAKAMGGHDRFYVCCDDPTLWNVEKISKTYGYSDFYGKDLIADEIKTNGYKVDKALLEEVSRLIPEHKKPFMCLVATAGMHHPYNTPMEPATWIGTSGLYTNEVRCYLEAANAFDIELDNFIRRLKASGDYDNTMIVIVSDHNEMVDDAPLGRPSIDADGDNCVFLAINSGQNGWIEGPIGQIDVYPTLLDLLGLNQQQWKGLGYSLLRFDVNSAATSPGTASGNGTYINRQQEAWQISELLITSRWFAPKQE